jgi:hypothetical protein
MSVAIRGTGVAALSCAFLLQSRGLSVQSTPAGRRRLPAILLPDSAYALSDILGVKEILQNAHRIERRVIQWGPGALPIVVPHSAVVVSENSLLEQIPCDPPNAVPEKDPDWTIICGRPFPADISPQVFGTRRATVVAVAIDNSCDAAACWIESLPAGWLFLIPERQGRGWLISVGSLPELNLERSELVRSQLRGIEHDRVEFASSPAISWPLAGRKWLACGSAALRFDPLCGDGTGHALRQAILASAIVRAERMPANDLITHYRMRLLAAFHRHLSLCRSFYQSGGQGPWWVSEVAALDAGIEWCNRRLADAPGGRYRLDGWDLEPVPPRE